MRQHACNSKGQWITPSLIGVHHYCNNTNIGAGGKKNKCINGTKIARRQTRGTTIGKPKLSGKSTTDNGDGDESKFRSVVSFKALKHFR